MEPLHIDARALHCRICTNQCGMIAELAGDRIIKVRADRSHPLSQGYSCPKGRALGGVHHHPDAILAPRVRRGGALAVAEWDEALDDIALRLKNIVDRHGPDAVGVYFGSGLGMDASGYRLAELFHTALGTPARFSPVTIDGTAKVLVASMVGGFPGLNPKTDYDAVDMLLYVGVNPMVSHGHNTGMFNPAVHIRAAATRGEVWTIDPLRTETARFSTGHIAPAPGSDHAILAWLVREILEGGPLSPAQPVQQLDALKAAVAAFDLDTAARLSGVAPTDLSALLAAIRRHGHVVVETGTGVTMSASANVTQWLAWVLMILTGRMNRPGGTWFHPGFITRFDSFDLPVIDSPLSPGAPTMPGVSGIIGEWPCAALPGEIEAGNIRALINFGGSLVRSFPDANVLVPALEKLDLLVSFDIIANETTALSTHVLPTKDQTERADVSLWDTLSASLSMLYSPPVVPPQGERRSAWWVIAEIMRRAGMAVPDHVPASDREPGADEAMLESLMHGARCSFDKLRDEGVVTLPLEFPGTWVDDHIARMGGWNLAPEALVQALQALPANPDASPETPADTAPPLRFISRRQRRKLNAALDFLGSPADLMLHPDDAAARGIVHGAPVRAFTDRGEITLTAHVTDTIRRGVVSIPHGHASANVNRLTSAEAVDSLTGMVLYTGIPLSVESAA